MPILAVVITLAFAVGLRRRIAAGFYTLFVGLRRRIAAGFYTLFVGILRIGIRMKRFLDHAVKEAAGSVEKNPPG
jgi:flagellar biosynthesis protein FliR